MAWQAVCNTLRRIRETSESMSGLGSFKGDSSVIITSNNHAAATFITGAEVPLYRSAPFPWAATTQRRHLTITRQQEHSERASLSDHKDDGFATDHSSWTGFDAGSSLSPAEQAEKNRRLQSQAEEKRILREQLAQRKQQRDKQFRTVQSQRPNRQDFGERRLNLGQPQNVETVMSPSVGENKDDFDLEESARIIKERASQRPGMSDSTVNSSVIGRHNQRQAGRSQGKNRSTYKEQDVERLSHAQDHDSVQFPTASFSSKRPWKEIAQQSKGSSSDDAQSRKDKLATLPDSERVAAPQFRSRFKDQSARSATAFKTGWGSGSTNTKPVEHGEGREVIKTRQPQNDSSKTVTVIDTGIQDTAGTSIGHHVRMGEKRATTTCETSQSNHLPNSKFSNGVKQGFGLSNTDGYTTMPVGQGALPDHADAFIEDHSANWQHLRRKNVEHIRTEPDVATEPPLSQSSNMHLDDSWVDRSFEEHRRKRAASSYPSSDRIPTTERQLKDTSSISSTQNARKSCGRCGQTGHSARQCPGRPQITCYTCGQPGHLANRCPNITAVKGATDRPRAYLTDPYAEEPDSLVRKVQGKGRGLSDFEAPATTATTRTTDSSRALETEHKSRYQKLDDDDMQKQSGPSRRGQWIEASDTVPIDEQTSDDRPSRRKRWADGGDEADQLERSGDRRGQRRNHRRDEDDDERLSARDEARARKQARLVKKEAERQAARMEREARKAQQASPIRLPEFISVQNLSQTLGVRYEQFVDRLEELGYDDVFPGKVLNTETSGMIAMEYNFEPVFDIEALEEEDRDLKARPNMNDKEFLPVRPPVVTIMGHVDHGKTTLLDYLRKSSVAAGEAGGITQHIGAFSVPLSSSGKAITFLDTPGHAAFLAMRQRGANVTDIVVLVVAADDSVKPQTLEAIKHAKAAGVPMIVAINKIDKAEADVQRCKQDLARHGVEIEDFGGDTQVVEVSGKTGKGMEDLEETVVTLSEILDHRAETDGDVEGWILEATTKKAGRVATVLVRRGTLRPGNIIVAGKTWARVKTLRNEGGRLLDQVGPGMPIEVDGWKDQPTAGDEVLQAANERKATSVVEYRHELAEREKIARDMEAINEGRRLEQEKREKEKIIDATAQGSDENPTPATDTETYLKTSGQIEVPFIIKADVSGSAEAVSAYILGVSNPMIAPKILRSSVGAITESDIELASVAQGHVIAFNLRSDPEMNGIAEAKGVRVLENNIIYRVLDNVKSVLEDKLPLLITQKVMGEAEVAASFEIGIGGRKKVKIAGCKVRNGVITKGSRVRVIRAGDKVYDGTVESLKNVKKDVQEMRKGSDCGIGFDTFENFEVGDQIQTYEEISEKRRL